MFNYFLGHKQSNTKPSKKSNTTARVSVIDNNQNSNNDQYCFKNYYNNNENKLFDKIKLESIDNQYHSNMNQLCSNSLQNSIDSNSIDLSESSIYDHSNDYIIEALQNNCNFKSDINNNCNMNYNNQCNLYTSHQLSHESNDSLMDSDLLNSSNNNFNTNTASSDSISDILTHSDFQNQINFYNNNINNSCNENTNFSIQECSNSNCNISNIFYTNNGFQIQLWQFLLELLLDKSCECFIKWTNENENEFVLIDPNEVAKRWVSTHQY